MGRQIGPSMEESASATAIGASNTNSTSDTHTATAKSIFAASDGSGTASVGTDISANSSASDYTKTAGEHERSASAFLIAKRKGNRYAKPSERFTIVHSGICI